MTGRYGVKYADGGFSGELTEHKSLINAYAREHQGAVVYDSEDPNDPIAAEARAAFKPKETTT